MLPMCVDVIYHSPHNFEINLFTRRINPLKSVIDQMEHNVSGIWNAWYARCRGGLVTFVTYPRSGLPGQVSRNHGSCRPSPVTLSKAPCRVSLSNGRRGITRSHGFSLDLRLPSRNTTYRSSGSPFGTS